jgi:hypothetical protein
MPKVITPEQRFAMATNFINNYGYDAFVDMLQAFSEGVTSIEAAKKLGITRQRANQWRQAFTYEKTYIHSDIKKMLAGKQ